jgi:hypothetical protein
MLEVAALGRTLRHRDQSSVPDRPPGPLPFLCLQDAEQLDVHEAAGVGRSVQKDQHVERIAILGAGAGDEAEIERERHARRQAAAHPEDLIDRLVLQLVATPLGRLDDRSQSAVIAPRRDPVECCHSILLCWRRSRRETHVATQPIGST